MSQPRTFRELFGFLALCIGVGYAIEYRTELLSWLLSLPAHVFVWLMCFGAAIVVGAWVFGLVELADWLARREARKQGARHV